MSDTRLRELLRTQLDDLKAKGLYKRERLIQSPQGTAITVNGREVVNFCANNYLGLANHPEIVAAARDGLDKYGYGLSQRPLHLRHAGPAPRPRTDDRAVSRQGRRHPLHLVLRRQRRPVRDAARRGRRRHQRRTEPRQHHRRRPAVQGEAAPLQARRHGRPGAVPDRGEVGPAAADRHRQRLLDGRRPGPAAGDLRPGRPARRRRDDRRIHATGHLGPTGRGAAEQLGVLDRIDIITSTLGKTLGGARRRLHDRPSGDRRLPAAALAAVPVLELAAAVDRDGGEAGLRAGRDQATTCATGCAKTRSGCDRRWSRRASR